MRLELNQNLTLYFRDNTKKKILTFKGLITFISWNDNKLTLINPPLGLAVQADKKEKNTMIDENLKIEKKEGGNFEPLNQDIYSAELMDIIQREETNYQQSGTSPKFQFQFIILEGVDQAGNEARTRSLIKRYVPITVSNTKKYGKNSLLQIIEALVGKELTEEEYTILDGKFLNGLIGEQCRVLIQNKQVNNNVFSNIENYLPATEKKTPLTDDEKEEIVKRFEDFKKKKNEQNNTQENEEQIDISKIPFGGDEPKKVEFNKTNKNTDQS